MCFLFWSVEEITTKRYINNRAELLSLIRDLLKIIIFFIKYPFDKERQYFGCTGIKAKDDWTKDTMINKAIKRLTELKRKDS